MIHPFQSFICIARELLKNIQALNLVFVIVFILWEIMHRIDYLCKPIFFITSTGKPVVFISLFMILN